MRTLILVGALLSGFALAACGGNDSGGSDRTYTYPATAAPATSTTATQTQTGTTTTATTPHDYTSFQSPSGNIGCAAIEQEVVQVRCDIRKHSWASPAKPADCDVDYGNGLVIEAGSEPQFVCAGDTTLNSGPVLQYGETNKTGLISCKSTEAGITCLDDETGRGFFLAREHYQLY